jgi:hypothetical protein
MTNDYCSSLKMFLFLNEKSMDAYLILSTIIWKRQKSALKKQDHLARRENRGAARPEKKDFAMKTFT